MPTHDLPPTYNQAIGETDVLPSYDDACNQGKKSPIIDNLDPSDAKEDTPIISPSAPDQDPQPPIIDNLGPL